MDDGAPQSNINASSQYLLIAMRYECLALDLMARDRTLEAELIYPARFLMLHAVEMYLISWLTYHGVVIDKGHNFETKVEGAREKGLRLREKTFDHIKTLKQEYFLLRYGDVEAVPIPPLNRLQATLREVSKKVSSVLCPSSK